MIREADFDFWGLFTYTMLYGAGLCAAGEIVLLLAVAAMLIWQKI